MKYKIIDKATKKELDYSKYALTAYGDVLCLTNGYVLLNKQDFIIEIIPEKQEKAEEDRLAKMEAERIENERIRIENRRLQKEAEEAEEREPLAKIEREKLEKEREIERKKQAEILAKAKAEAEAKARIEAEKQAEILAKAKAEAEKKAQKEKERIELELEKKSKNAPEKEKLIKFAELIEKLIRPEIKTEEAQKIMNDVNNLLSKVSNFIREKSEIL